MKRDMDLCREILQQIEDRPAGYNQPVQVEVEGGRRNEVAEHVRLLDEACLLEAVDCSSSDGIDWKPLRLTWEGHEFLALTKNETIWAKAKKKVLEKTGGLAFDLLTQALLRLAAKGLDGER